MTTPDLVYAGDEREYERYIAWAKFDPRRTPRFLAGPETIETMKHMTGGRRITVRAVGNFRERDDFKEIAALVHKHGEWLA